MENRLGLVVNAMVTPATGTAERDAAVALINTRPSTRRITVGSDKNYATAAAYHLVRIRNLVEAAA